MNADPTKGGSRDAPCRHRCGLTRALWLLLGAAAAPIAATETDVHETLEAEVRRLRAELAQLQRDSANLALEDSVASLGGPYLLIDAARRRVEVRLAGAPLRTAPMISGAGWPAAATSTRAVVDAGPCVWATSCTRLESGAWLAVHGRDGAGGGWRSAATAAIDVVHGWLARLSDTVWVVVPAAELAWLRPRIDQGLAVVLLPD